METSVPSCHAVLLFHHSLSNTNQQLICEIDAHGLLLIRDGMPGSECFIITRVTINFVQKLAFFTLSSFRV